MTRSQNSLDKIQNKISDLPVVGVVYGDAKEGENIRGGPPIDPDMDESIMFLRRDINIIEMDNKIMRYFEMFNN